MRIIVSIRWKILAGFLVLAILPMLLLTYLFSDIASNQISEQIELMADQAGRYIMQGVSQQEDELLEALDLLSHDEELLNAIHFGHRISDPGEVHAAMKHSVTQMGLDRLELINADGHKHTLDRTSPNQEPFITPKTETERSRLKMTSDTQILIEEDRLVITAVIPLTFEDSQIGNLRTYHFIDNDFTNELLGMTGADIAFHDGNKILASSISELKNKQLDLDSILDEDAVQMKLNNRPHIVYNYPLNYESAGFLIAIDQSPINAAKRTMQRTLIMTSIGVMTFALVLGIFISRGIARPIDSVVRNLQEISEGDADLTKKLTISSNDEIGILANSFNLFVERLRQIVESTRKTGSGLIDAISSIRNRSSEVSHAADQQTKALEKSHRAITEIGNTSGEIADNVSNLVASVQQSAAATHELQSTTHSINDQMENLFGIISNISSSIHQLSSSNEQIDSNIIELSGNARETSKSAEELEQATLTIEQSAERTSKLAQQAATDALEGKAAVQDTICGISDLEEMMEQAYQTIQDLGSRSDAIGNIINVIDEVADQTNLLALNAAIIAAQAGEHGQGFAVVAEEIRNLAERTSVSTKEIASIIENLQQGTKTAISTIEAGTLRAQQEVARSAAAGGALEKLHESSLISTEQITGIARQTQKQSEENRTIVQAVLGITKMLDQISISISQQTASTRNLSDAAESMKNIAARVKNSTTEQNRGSRQIALSMEHIQQMIEKIDDATRGQNERSNEVVESVAMVSRIAKENANRANGMDSTIESLLEHTALLQQEMGAFKIDNAAEELPTDRSSD